MSRETTSTAVLTPPGADEQSDSLVGAASLSTESFNRLARFITGELGIKMPDCKLTMVQSRLLRRVRELRLASVEDYVERFLAGSLPEEQQRFIDAITTNKTDFFREPDHFAFLDSAVLPRFMAATGGRPERFLVWSAGCSSGEEPYTLAMALSEYRDRERGFDFAILATDISREVLETARAAIYPHDRVLPVPPALRKKYLLRNRKGEDVVRIAPELRRKVTFHPLNFMDDHYPTGDVFDAIFFRNVMIYFDRPTQEAVIQKLCRRLKPGGYFFAGHSESLAGLDVPLTAVTAAVYRKISV